MKINVLSILKGHLLTLYDAKSGKISKLDIFIFYLGPFILGLICYWCRFYINESAYTLSITFFGIFLALLLNIQVAIFGIFQRKWELPNTPREKDASARKFSARQELLSELNTNISYLTVFCSLALIVFLGFFLFSLCGPAETSTLVFCYAHFILSFLMVVKRAHALFEGEYRKS